MQKKSVFLVIICLFLGAGLSQLSAQSDVKTHTEWRTNLTFWVDVYCDGEIVDFVEANVRVHLVRHGDLETWDIDWVKYQVKGEGESQWTGEKFTYKEIDRYLFADEGGYYTWHYHLKGNRGSKYMGHVTVDADTWEWIIGPTNCH